MMILRPLLLFAALWLAVAQGAMANPFQGLSDAPLRPDQAFRYEVTPGAEGQAQIRWTIAPGYYLYRDRFTARDTTGRDFALQTPAGEIREDLNFGAVEVYPRDMTLSLSGAYGPVTIAWQGCQNNGICYAPQSAVIELPGAAAAPASEAAALTAVEILRSEDRVLWVLAGFAGLAPVLILGPCVTAPPAGALLYIARSGAGHAGAGSGHAADGSCTLWSSGAAQKRGQPDRLCGTAGGACGAGGSAARLCGAER